MEHYHVISHGLSTQLNIIKYVWDFLERHNKRQPTSNKVWRTVLED